MRSLFSFLLPLAIFLLASGCSTMPPLVVPFPQPPAVLMLPPSPLKLLPAPLPRTTAPVERPQPSLRDSKSGSEG